MTLIIEILFALFIAWIWIDYFRQIDIFEREKLRSIILSFLLGGASVSIVYLINYVLEQFFVFSMNGTFINDFKYCVFNIGLVEEVSKLIPFLILLLIIRKEINEPIDYLIYLSVSALGFSAAENVLYIHKLGFEVIPGRSILSTITHMFNTSLIAYGIILYKYRNKPFSIIFLYIFYAALSHGIYDFYLMFKEIQLGFLYSFAYFLITISWYAIILNNAINNSRFFTYKKVINIDKILIYTLIYYSILLLSTFTLLAIKVNIQYGLERLLSAMYLIVPIILISVTRLSRLKLIKGYWEPLKIEFPFRIIPTGIGGIRLVLKGDSYNETSLNAFFEEEFILSQISHHDSNKEGDFKAFIESKFYYKHKNLYYVAKVYKDDFSGDFERVLLRPKVVGRLRMKNKLPIVALLKLENSINFNYKYFHPDHAKFVKWMYCKPIH